MEHDNDRPWNDPRGSHFWRSLTASSLAFNCSVKHQIGDGKDTSFWHDNWHGTALKHVYPNLYNEVRDKHTSVHRYLSTMDTLSQTQLLDPLAQAEKDRMLSELQYPLLTHDRDTIFWLRNPAGFTVSSAYHFLSHTPSPTSDLRNIWSIKAPLRVLVFAWRLLTNRLATTDNLVKRGWELPSMCALCRRNQETTMHIIQQCPLVKQIRSYVHATVPAQKDISPKFNGADSLQVLTDPTENLVARQWELLTCFIIWRERCRRVFSGKSTAQMELVREIRSDFKNWFN